MTPREIRQALREIIGRAKDYAGDQNAVPFKSATPYVLGGIKPFVALDCRGLVRKAYGQYKKAIGGALGNVRAFAKWATDNGRLLDHGQRGWPFVWSEITDKPEPGNPLHRRHIGIKLTGRTKKHPNGWAVSAYNPKRDTIYHDLYVPGMKVEFIKPDWSLVPADDEPPITDPEPPIA